MLLVHKNAVHVSEPGFDGLGITHGSHCSLYPLSIAARLRSMTDVRLPDPALVVLAGAAGSGKSTWAAERFRISEVVSSEALRAAVGTGPSDLDASVEAFTVLDQIVTARTRRSLTTVIDTLGLDPVRRSDYLRLARATGLPAVLVIMRTAATLCRERNRLRDRPVPAP